MKKLLTIFAVLLSTVAFGQAPEHFDFSEHTILRTSHDSIVYPPYIQIGRAFRMHGDTLVIKESDNVKFISIGGRTYKVSPPTLEEVQKSIEDGFKVIWRNWDNIYNSDRMPSGGPSTYYFNDPMPHFGESYGPFLKLPLNVHPQ